MGSPVSSTVANLFMEDFEDRALSLATEKQFAPRLWKRYVDDVYSIIKLIFVSLLLDHLNNQHEQINITSEQEKDNKLAFLDTNTRRQNSRIVTSVFRKETHTNRVLSFESHHPVSAKRAVVLSLFDRVRTHFSKEDVEGQEKEKDLLFDVLRANGYPRLFVEQTLHKSELNRKRRLETKNECSQEKEKEEIKSVVVIPYVENVSEQVKRLLAPLGIKVVCKADKWQWRICSGLKDVIPMENKTGVVYEIDCNDCQASYIGETLRSIKTRIEEHKRHSRNGRFDLSAVAEHSIFNNHTIDWEGSKIIGREDRWHARKIKEALLISKHNPTMNKDKGTELSLSWLRLTQSPDQKSCPDR